MTVLHPLPCNDLTCTICQLIYLCGTRVAGVRCGTQCTIMCIVTWINAPSGNKCLDLLNGTLLMQNEMRAWKQSLVTCLINWCSAEIILALFFSFLHCSVFQIQLHFQNTFSKPLISVDSNLNCLQQSTNRKQIFLRNFQMWGIFRSWWDSFVVLVQ